MAKKKPETKTPAPEKPAAPAFKPTPRKAAAPEVTAPQIITPKAKAAVPAPAKKTAVKRVGAPKLKALYTQDDVALRAYFIAEKRQALGLPGDAHSDWVEAERQLDEESRKPAAKKAAR